jgi:hypothetical protein
MKVILLNFLIFTTVIFLILGIKYSYAGISDGQIYYVSTHPNLGITGSSIVPINLNNDKITDLFHYSPFQNLIEFHNVTSSGSITQVNWHLGQSSTWSSIVPINLNNDGITDLLFYSSFNHRLTFNQVSSSGSMNQVASIDVGPTLSSIVPINLNNDGITDLLFYSASEHTGYFITVSSSGIINHVATYTDWRPTWSSIVPINLNNDKITDLLFYSPSENTGEFYKVSSSGVITNVATHTDWPSTWSVIIPVTLNDDGITDLLFYSALDETGKFYKVSSSGSMNHVASYNWGPTWSSIVPINLNNDKITDLLFYSASQQTAELYKISSFNPNGDPDNDRLISLWEIEGIDSNSDGNIDLVLPSSSPSHKDLYVEVDFMQFHRPNDNSIQHVIGNFSNAPVSNPNGVTGINLHVEIDEELTHEMTTDLDDLIDFKNSNFGTAMQRTDPNSDNIITAKTSIYHYGLFAHTQPGTSSSGRTNGIPAMEFLVTLGDPGWGNDPVTGHDVGSIDQQEGTFMHELGHNLNLEHGGDDGVNCKPNYLSVMSYSTQFSSLILNRPLDYSRSEIENLNEFILSEPNGIEASNPIGLDTAVGPVPADIVPTGNPVDWNRDGDKVDTTVIADINNVRQTGDCRASPPLDNNAWLYGHNDWANLMYIYSQPCIFCALEETNMVNKSDDTIELTIEEVIEDRITLFERIKNTLKSLPLNAFKNPEAALQLKDNLSLPLQNETISLENLLRTDKVDQAIAMLNVLKSKTDSSIGGIAKDDLITNPNAQRKVLPLIEYLILVLEKQK